MSEFLQLAERIKGEIEDASRFSETRTFAGSMGADFLKEDGFGRRWAGMRRSPQYPRLLKEALDFTARCRDSRYGFMRFEEAMNTADFPLLMGDVIDRQLLGMYQESPYSWANYARRGRVPDFRSVKRFAVDGAEGVLPTVGESGEYLPQVVKETKYSYAVTKKGRQINWSWESFINDDLDALGSSSPARLAKAARRSEEKFATTLFVDANGPHASLYTSGNKNIVNATNSGSSFTAVNPPLSIAALQQAYAVLGNMVDADGEPITVDSFELVVPPSLEVTAQNILNGTEIWVTGAASGGASGQELHAVNWMRSKVRLSVNYYIPIVASSSNGNTSWFLFASVNSGRPALEVGFLRGHETPELFQRIGNQMRIGGGGANVMDGSFEDDSIAFKVRHVFGGTSLDPKASVASNGSGS